MSSPVTKTSFDPHPDTLITAAQRLARGEITSRQLVEHCLNKIETCENARAAFTGDFSAERARQYADAADRIRAKGYQASPWAGVPISVKDLFDIKGQVTRAGSTILADRPPALSDAEAIAPLRDAGFIFIGRTQMTEFAYSGLGLNPHGPQPWNTLIDEGKAIPGGSSSGGAVSVATGAALAAIGSDTGGSCRIPAAMNALTGYKPSAGRISRAGMIPLSPSFDSVGSIARTVSDCALLDHLMAGGNPGHWSAPEPVESGLRLLLPTSFVRNDADAQILAVFETVMRHLESGGIEIVRQPLPLLQDIADLNIQAQIVAAESFHYFHDDLIQHPDQFDPRVSERMMMGEHTSVQTLRQLFIERQKLIARFNAEMSGFDAMVCPTTPILPPQIAACFDPDSYGRFNRLVLRNPSLANLLDGCSITLPLNWKGLPAGIMLTACNGQDSRVQRVARRCEVRLSAS
ncbi:MULTISPECIES: amidase [Asaia]|uniref:Asp-tRNAAsn/Glu-tRNAGln amidotransferase A subunit and related amidases n=1 Tax=Asaia bogorensis TaxID=91915 RepID=A0A060QFK6_9PROT|nr:MULTISPECIES: amidase [Asaia]ETC99812.1 amidase [Asaia sp. SF2.1]CDG39478.1 Asp-tRNAAsn/Glu-tRNAGln amidotransferase A subunit and related amidases [Asaia bogorensis]